ncbi:glycogen/starch/alpha-glucan phosphorylase [Endozoicomonas sp. SESOKO1]|uniref:glycogen/starch/alpha-glucan phosphorylase n=1 Tax=Endozoicomonas sp. SESOKO1 TaxID=2828742 RepID=UPI002148855A|nr:glycogen/starch/alpha-glucan phosphorylase [Endozoicomonas sp. SESOKO1]
MDQKAFTTKIEKHLRRELGTTPKQATYRDWWQALSLVLRDINLDQLQESSLSDKNAKGKQPQRHVCYLSMEFLMGRLLGDALMNLGLYEPAARLLQSHGVKIADVLDQERDMSLGNGGLGRLAACFMDSLANQNIPATGYGINYRYGLFRQVFENGHQKEMPDVWREFGSPWETCRPSETVEIGLFGRVEMDSDGNNYWVPAKKLLGVPWDITIPSFGGQYVNRLRLWESQVGQYPIDLDKYNQGEYLEACRNLVDGDTISGVLYPEDSTPQGKDLRLIQQYFFSACSLQDILRQHKSKGLKLSDLPKHYALQLNDTHPAIAIPELMRLLMDEEGMVWNEAWDITRKMCHYTNHTLLPEALEKWSAALLGRILPRHLQIIEMINHVFLTGEAADQWGDNVEIIQKVSIFEELEDGDRLIRMANLSVIGSRRVNGVAALHSSLVKSNLFPEFNELYPGKLVNVTNGVTPRRWLAHCNPCLARLLDRNIGTEWRTDLTQLKQLEPLASKEEFLDAFAGVRFKNKERLARLIEKECRITVNPNALFDVQIKRLHEYKRQQMNLLHIISLYHEILDNPDAEHTPRVFIFGAKAAPGYVMAKQIILAINKVAKVINNDRRLDDRLKVVFLPDYRVTIAEQIIPAADVSEQISTAGFEASGTGNMKLGLNGALTVGTMDGANVEIAEAVGSDNIFIFGKTVDEVEAIQKKGYNPYQYYEKNPVIKRAINSLMDGSFSQHSPELLKALAEDLIHNDPFMALADFESYRVAQQKAAELFRKPRAWWKKAVLNTARLGHFSSDRSIADYAEEVWKI